MISFCIISILTEFLSQLHCYQQDKKESGQVVLNTKHYEMINTNHKGGGRRGHDRVVDGAYHTKIVSSNPAHGKIYSIQHYMIKVVSNLRP